MLLTATVIRVRPHREYDKLYTLYTKERGKMRAIAAGIKKPAAKLRGHLEPLSLSRIRLVPGKNRERIIGASLLDFWPGIRESGEKLALAHYMAHRIDRECMEGQKDEALWDMARKSFSALNRHADFGSASSAFVGNFENDLREALGYGRAEDGAAHAWDSGMSAPEWSIMQAWENWMS